MQTVPAAGSPADAAGAHDAHSHADDTQLAYDVASGSPQINPAGQSVIITVSIASSLPLMSVNDIVAKTLLYADAAHSYCIT